MSGCSRGQRFTELPNPKTRGIDLATAEDGIALLQTVDEELFVYDGKSTTSDDFVSQIESVALAVREAIAVSSESSAVILSGAGTSGRLACFFARNCNSFLISKGKTPCFYYLIAGGDEALFRSIEHAEDDPRRGVSDLCDLIASIERVRALKKILFIGITCGMSAPYVLGQCEYCLSRPDHFFCAVLGFVTAACARDAAVEGWNRTVRQVVLEMEEKAASEIRDGSRRTCAVLSTIVGPEGITGSTRMKGGSMTKIVLDTIFSVAVDSSLCVRQVFSLFQKTYCATYEQLRGACFSSVVSRVGDSLRDGHRVLYVGVDSLGVVGIIDASECPPTFGAQLTDVSACRIEKEDHLADSFFGSVERILRDVIPSLSENDVVVVLTSARDFESAELLSLLERLGDHSCVLYNVHWGKLESDESQRALFLQSVPIELPFDELIPSIQFRQFSAKIVCNLITTLGFVRSGKVFQNSMIDLRLSNNKLFFRALQIVRSFLSISEDDSRRLLLRSVYCCDSLTKEIEESPISTHVRKAMYTERVVPRAFLLGMTGESVDTVQGILLQNPVVREVIANGLSSRGSLPTI